MKKTVTKMIMGALVVMIAGSSCKKDGGTTTIDTTNNGSFKVYTQGNVTTVQNLPGDTILGINPTSGQPYGSGMFKFFSLETGQLIANTDSATTKWDVAFRGTTILTNSGTSGPGVGGAYVQVGLFGEVTKVATDSTFRTDAAAPNYAITARSNKGWYVYDGANNLVTPIPGRVLMIRTASGKYAKVEIMNYYKGGVTPPINTPDAVKIREQRYYNFRYTYQASGSMTF
jgi:hypothetical protein